MKCAENLSGPVQFVKGVGPKVSRLLEKKGIKTIEDLLYFLPRRYEDRRKIDRIAELQVGARATIIGEVKTASLKYYGRTKVFEALVSDESGTLTAKWFRGGESYLKQTFRKGQRVILTGEVRGSFFNYEMIHPDYESIDPGGEDSLHFRRIVPIYSETEGLRQKHLRRIIRSALDDYVSHVVSAVPRSVCESSGLKDLTASLREAHFPGIGEDIDVFNEWNTPTHNRLIFEEFFSFEMALALRKRTFAKEKGCPFERKGELLDAFYRTLSFDLTAAQKRVIIEIESDLAAESPMHRLLQGDVGCGKTVVAMAALIRAVENGYQGAIMAPTDILAGQHAALVRKWGMSLSLRVGVLTGSLSLKDSRETQEKIASGELDIVVGTHALIQEKVSFKNLGLAVIDEQHRFGVVQRQRLRDKGREPHVLVMTATPIPRSLAMTVYGDLDLSVIDEMPPGRKPVRTRIFHEDERENVYKWIRRDVEKGGQVFVIYPLVEESETLDLKDATRMAEHLQRHVFPDLRIGLVHGRMKGAERDRIMADFASRRLDILVSTTVVEVGIDVPEASLMVIEHADRFGLSQLHQLRGRVGRGETSSCCILMAPLKCSDLSAKRLRIIAGTNDGFRIAEEDLMIRGPGEFMGTRQSGLPDFRVAGILRDGKLLEAARQAAFAVVEQDPDLEKPEHAQMKEVLISKWGDRLNDAKTG